MLYSDFVGFGNLRLILIQRMLFLTLGISFIFASIPLFPRLRQSKTDVPVAITFAVIGLCTACWLGFQYLDHFERGITLRTNIRALNQQYDGIPEVSVTDCSIHLLHTGETIEVETLIVLKNDTGETADSLVFSLNPGLHIDSITRDGNHVEFKRNIHLVTVKPITALQSDSVDSLLFRYSGSIDEDACYPDIEESYRGRINKMFLTTIDKRYSFITPDYVLLTRENLWYPVPGVWAYFCKEYQPHKYFTNYKLTVTTKDNLVPISQGAGRKIDDGVWQFSPEYPLTQISLAIGKYKQLTITHDGICYNLYNLEGNDYFLHEMVEMKEGQIQKRIKYLRDYFEYKMNISYPFERFSIVEVPVQFLAHYRPLLLQTESLQPELVFLPERGVLIPSHAADIKRTKRNLRRNSLSSNQLLSIIESSTFGRTMLDIFSEQYPTGLLFIAQEIAREKKIFSSSKIFAHLEPSYLYDFKLFPMFYNFSCDFSANEYPIFDLLFGYYIKSRMWNIPNDSIVSNGVRVNRLNIAHNMMTGKPISELIFDEEKSFAVPEVLMLKAEELFCTLEYLCGGKKFEDFINSYSISHRFEPKSGDILISEIENKFNINIKRFYDQIMDISKFPSFIIYDVEKKKVNIRNQGNMHSVDFDVFDFNIYNKGNDGGLIRCDVYSKGGLESRYVYLDAHQAKKIGIAVLPSNNRRINFRTFNARNKRHFVLSAVDESIVDTANIINSEIIIDPPLQEPGIIVDDNDGGFSIVENGNRNLLIKIFNLDKSSTYELKYYEKKKSPPHWQKTFDEYENLSTDFFSNLISTVYYVKSGDGTKKVQWKADIPESGYYDIFYYTPQLKKFELYTREGGYCAVKDFHFTINHDGGAEDLVVDISRSDERWFSLGTYYISKGESSVELTDESKGKFVYADAVKWVKK